MTQQLAPMSLMADKVEEDSIIVRITFPEKQLNSTLKLKVNVCVATILERILKRNFNISINLNDYKLVTPTGLIMDHMYTLMEYHLPSNVSSSFVLGIDHLPTALGTFHRFIKLTA